jgi:threonine synthase
MEHVSHLRCRECGATYPLEPRAICDECFGPVEVEYDLGIAAPRLTPEAVAAGPPSLWRYAGLLPADGPAVDLGAGFTPLRRAVRLGERLGLADLWIKDDTRNPSGSFKDRVVSVAITAAIRFGFEAIACASTGNLANATAAAAAAAGIPAYVFIPADLERAKVAATAAYGATVVAVEGNYDDVNRICSELAETRPWAFVNVNVRAFYAEGSKTLGFETAEQLGWRLPDHVVVPIASGALLTKIHRGFRQLVGTGSVDERPVRFSGAQAAGCNPVAAAFRDEAAEIRPVKPSTIAKSLAIGNPADGSYALRLARETDGAIEDVTDDEVIAGIRLLAEAEGIFTETAGGVTIGVLRKLAERGIVGPDETVVAYVTGNGFKTVEALEGTAKPAVTVSTATADVERALDGLRPREALAAR